MRKVLMVMVLFLSVVFFVSGQEIFDAAESDNFSKFRSCAEKMKSLDEKDGYGLPVQLSLIYFSDKNFEKACEYLAKKKFDFDKPEKNGMTLLFLLVKNLEVNKIKILLNYNVDVNKEVNGMLPIQATQFSTYKYHTEQEIDPIKYEKEKEIHELLLNKGSKPFTYLIPTISLFGNFMYCFSYVIFQCDRSFNPYYLNDPENFEVYKEGDRLVASFKYDLINSLLNQYVGSGEVSRYTEDIISKINEAVSSKDKYLIMGFTGKSKIAPDQWVLIKYFYNKTSKQKESDCIKCINSDTTYDYAKYYIKDLTEIILVKIN